MTDGSVCLAYVHSNEVAHSWHRSVIDLLGYDLSHKQRVLRGGFSATHCGTGGLVAARNDTAARFLGGDAEWLFWVDTDMGFAPDTVDRLLSSADPTDRPVVGALCFSQHGLTPDGMGGFRFRASPTLYRWARTPDGQEGFSAWLDYPHDELVPVAGTGSACLIVHRDVLAKMAEVHGPNWYSRMTNPTTGQLVSEDLSFCARAAGCGFPIHVDTRVKTSHLKPVWLSEDDYDGR